MLAPPPRPRLRPQTPSHQDPWPSRAGCPLEAISLAPSGTPNGCHLLPVSMPHGRHSCPGPWLGSMASGVTLLPESTLPLSQPQMSPEGGPPVPSPVTHRACGERGQRVWEVLGVPVRCVTGAAMENEARTGCRLQGGSGPGCWEQRSLGVCPFGAELALRSREPRADYSSG